MPSSCRELSVVIPCRDDRRVVETVRSIDAPVEVVIVLNGSPPEFERWLRRELPGPARWEVLAHPNRARAVEHGIRAAANPWVLLMDSDCVFAPGSVAATIRAFEQGDPGAEVYKGTIVYDAGTTRMGRVVSRSRTQRNRRLSAYKPALAFSREIAHRLGGYFFDERLIWKSDSELDARIRRAGLRVVGVEGCVVHHAPLTLWSDLYSSFHYGVGAAIGAHLGLELPEAERSVREAWQRDGALPASYLWLSNRLRAAGHAYARSRLRWSAGAWLARVSGG
jgi:GT2 family glycosyltransferase